MTELFEGMLTKETPPSYSSPTVSITSSITGLREVGENINPTITVTFNKNDGGVITAVELYKNNNLIDTKISPINPCSFTDNEVLTTATINYSAKIIYEEGPIKNTNLGNPYPNGHITAGSKTSSSISITPVYASYIGIIDSSYELNNLTKIIKNSKSYTYKYIMTNQRVVYLYPVSFGALTSVKDENNFEILNAFTRSQITLNGTSYYEYKLTNTGSNSDGTLKFS